MTMKKSVLVLALCPFAALAAEPRQPTCNAADFFQTQPDLTVGRVVDAGNVALVGEPPAAWTRRRTAAAAAMKSNRAAAW